MSSKQFIKQRKKQTSKQTSLSSTNCIICNKRMYSFNDFCKNCISFFDSIKDINHLRKTIKSCEYCKDLVKVRTQAVVGDGNKNAKIMFIAQNPGVAGRGGADKFGITLMGDKSGDLFEDILAKCNLTRDEVWTTNLVKCTTGKSFREPVFKEISICKHYLFKEIRLIRPKLIITFGRIATQSLLPETFSILQISYIKHFIKYPIETMIVPVPHPSYIIRQYKHEVTEEYKTKIVNIIKENV